MKNYRVFAFSEDVISIYNESNKSDFLVENTINFSFDTVLIYSLGGGYLELIYFKNGSYCGRNTQKYGSYPRFEYAIELAGTIQKEQKEEPLFSVGDRVFDWFYEWFIISHIKDNGDICCSERNLVFDKEVSKKCLSFTEYNFITGGWSQERPPQIGSWGWFWVDEYDLVSEEVVYGKLQKVEDGMYFTNENQYNNFSTKNPFEK